MIFVTDAGYQGIVALSACSTLPVSASTTSRASACTARGAARAREAQRRARGRVQRAQARQRAGLGSTTDGEAAGGENALLRSGPLRPAFEKKGGPEI